MNLSRRSIYVIAIAFAAFIPRGVHAQITRDTTHWNDEELYQEDKTSPSFFSVGGGLLGGYFMPDFSTFNTNVAQPFVKQNYRQQVWMIGGAGFVTLPWIKNVRVGGMGMSGTSSDCGCTNDTIQGIAVNRYLTYSVGYAALTIDYVLPLRTGRFHIIPGVALGYGGVDIYARQAQNRSNFDVGQFTKEFDSSNLYRTHTYTSHFFLYMPQIQFEYSPTGYMMLRLSAGYQGTSMGTWTVDQGLSLGPGPIFDGINGSGLVASLGVFLGLFQ
ncbi:MAG: hypothetical protein Q8922_01980 [Bacteroidota bacterium]|nr:hypothetical protein [Bacteroidota bacterium]MDP4232003.1 hypothetical protein [Bacteroidota bacterium]MDP4241290.1 hypothetical protein [Bacteroidota bacterium]MDP4286682.1 hypothetical protein [Bacteroidota bacterium]